MRLKTSGFPVRIRDGVPNYVPIVQTERASVYEAANPGSSPGRNAKQCGISINGNAAVFEIA